MTGLTDMTGLLLVWRPKRRSS